MEREQREGEWEREGEIKRVESGGCGRDRVQKGLNATGAT